MKYAIIQSSGYNSENFPSDWKNSDWHDVDVGGVMYKWVWSFDHYFTQNVIDQVDQVFNTKEELDQWIFENSTTENTVEI